MTACATFRSPLVLIAAVVSLSHLANPCGASAQRSIPTPQEVRLRLIAINDLHGNLEAGTLSLNWPNPHNPSATTTLRVGGAPALAGLITSLRQGAPHSLVISSGDLIGATPLISGLFRDEPTIAIANRLGINLAIPGNHEFDAGQSELMRLLNGGPHPPARFTMISANITTASGATLFPATAIHSVGSVRVGFIGAITRSTPKIVIASGITGLRFEGEAEAINRAAAALQRQGVEAIVAVIHEGGEVGKPGTPLDWNNTNCPDARGPIFAIARQLSPAIDVVFSAHSHQGYNCWIDGRPILQSTAFGRGVSVVDLAINPRTGDVDRANTAARNLPVLNTHTHPELREAILAAEPSPWRQVLEGSRPDPEVAALVTSYANAAAPKAQQVVGTIGGTFDRTGPSDSSAGRLLADAQLAATRSPSSGGAQAALINPGGIRADLPCQGQSPCRISYGDIFAMQPFGNTLVVLTLNGVELQGLLERQQPPGATKPTFLQPSATLRYQWVGQAPFGQRVRQLQLNGRPIQPSQLVRLVVNSFLAQGGDGFEGFLQGRDPEGGPRDVDALATFLASNPAPDPQPRITLVP